MPTNHPTDTLNHPKHTLNKKPKAALYLRVSTRWQIDKDSLPMQREELPKYAEIVLGIKDYEIFEDAGFSGKNTDRPAFQQMMSRCRQGEFTHILVYKLDRISRNLLDFAMMYQELRKLGITFISKNEQFDTSTAIGEAMLKIILIFAELERNMTSERVQATMINRAQNAQWNGGRIPFGYSYDPQKKEFSIDEQESEIVRKIYDLCIDGESLIQIAKELNSSFPTLRRGIEWNAVSIHKVITNPFMWGAYRYNRTQQGGSGYKKKPEKEWILIENHHPAIIPRSTQEKAIAALQARDRMHKEGHATYKRSNINIFAGLLTCAECGSQYYASSGRINKKSGERPSVYQCSGRRHKKQCSNKSVRDEEIGPFILSFLSNYIKAQSSFGQSTSISTLKKKLLRGPYLEGLDFDDDGIRRLYAYFRTSKFGTSDFMTLILSDGETVSRQDELSKEKALLESEQKRIERAIQRLKAVYLYSEESMAEKDFISENASLQSDLEKVNARLGELSQISSSFPDPISSDFASDDDFLETASLLVIQEEMLSKREPNYAKIISVLDPRILKEFINITLSNICIFSGKIRSITLKNGISLQFLDGSKK